MVTEPSRLLCRPLKELVGVPDRLRRTVLVNKERRCDATFAYQQIMVDVRREVLHYTSRSVYFLRCVIIAMSISIVLIKLMCVSVSTGTLCKQ